MRHRPVEGRIVIGVQPVFDQQPAQDRTRSGFSRGPSTAPPERWCLAPPPLAAQDPTRAQLHADRAWPESAREQGRAHRWRFAKAESMLHPVQRGP